jgi:hypothetical protein
MIYFEIALVKRFGMLFEINQENLFIPAIFLIQLAMVWFLCGYLAIQLNFYRIEKVYYRTINVYIYFGPLSLLYVSILKIFFD